MRYRPQKALAAALLCACAAAPELALAQAPGPTGGTSSGGVQIEQRPDNGGARYGTPIRHVGAKPAPRKKAKERRAKPIVAPVLRKFMLSSRRMWDEGRPIDLTFQINSRSRQVRVRLVARRSDGLKVGSIDLGMRNTRVPHTVQINSDSLAAPPEGTLQIKVTAYDSKSRRLVRQSDVPGWLDFTFYRHRFPLVGNFGFGHDDARFGAPRSGHIHKGQDLVAEAGTPVVAPRGGVVTVVRYQASGAGHYVVVDGANEDRDYIFMHLQSGSIAVAEGQRIPTGKLLGRVGSTGKSSGPHLHFEIWTGGHWFAGGQPIDPRPLLEQWLTQSQDAREAI